MPYVGKALAAVWRVVVAFVVAVSVVCVVAVVV